MTRRTHALALVAAGFAIGLLIAACQAPQPATLSSADETALRAIFEKAVIAARANDWPAFAALFSDDAQYRIRFIDADRWADELTEAFAGNLSIDARSTLEGDPDLL